MNETRRSLLVSSEWSTIAEHPVAELKEVFAVVGGQLRVLRGDGRRSRFISQGLE